MKVTIKEPASKTAIASHLVRYYAVGVVEAEKLVSKYNKIVEQAITAHEPAYYAADLIGEAEHLAQLEED